MLLILYAIGSVNEVPIDSDDYQNQTVQQYDYNNGLSSSFGSEIRLRSNGQNAYQYAGSADQTYDKRLIWDSDADSYYDAASDCWLWYNTDVEPAIWQYCMKGSPQTMEIMAGWSMIPQDGILRHLRVTGFNFPPDMIPANFGILWISR